jgi:DNA-binding transcriptional ArsR family regulator
MVAHKPNGGPTDFYRLAARFKSVSDPTRIRLLFLLDDGEQYVGALASSFSFSQPAISNHLSLLRFAGLIVPRRSGRQTFYALTDRGRDMMRVILGMAG